MKTTPLATAAVAISIAAAAGCASSGSSSSQPPGPSAPASTATVTSSAPPATSATPSPTSTAPTPCATSSLKVTLGLSEGYAGGVTVPIDFANTSSARCTLFGFPGVSLVTGPSRAQIGLAAKRSRNATPLLVTLAPGATAHAVLQIVDALDFPTATCQPTKATALRVYPPNQTAPVYLPSTATICAKPVQTLSITPIQPGPG